MGYLGELLACNQQQTLNFFFLGLTEGLTPSSGIAMPVVIYTASGLASYALTPEGSATDPPLARDLGEVYTNFVSTKISDPQTLEQAGLQTFVLVSFFNDQMHERYGKAHLIWYAEYARSCMMQASMLLRGHGAEENTRSNVLRAFGNGFYPLGSACANMSRNLRAQQDILNSHA
jgi:hypothetical protein